jgi:hypothetical protein
MSLSFAIHLLVRPVRQKAADCADKKTPMTFVMGVLALFTGTSLDQLRPGWRPAEAARCGDDGS